MAGTRVSPVPRCPHPSRTAEKRLAKAQQRLSRRTKRSKRWYTAARLVAKKHQQVRRQRQDFHHQTARALLRPYDVVSLEDLRVAHLVRTRHLSKSISDAGWGQFRTLLACKAACTGKQAALVEPAATSQECSGCGARVQTSVSVRTQVCPSCGLVLDRDQNAAKNMLRAGQAPRGAGAVVPVLKREAPSL